MRVNSAFTGFLVNRLVVGCSIVIVMLVIPFSASSYKRNFDPELTAKQVNIIIREIGHRLLLQAGDSSSRVLPVTQTKEGTFLLRFENEVVFNHDSLVIMTKGLLPKTAFPSGYAVTVHDCMNGDIVYGFQVSNSSPDILACSGRAQPPGCYKIEFAFSDFYENEEQQKADPKPAIEAIRGSRLEANPKLAELKATIDFNSEPQTEELQSAEVDRQEVKPKLEQPKNTTAASSLTSSVVVGTLLFGVILLTWRFRQSSKRAFVRNQSLEVGKQSLPEFPPLGKFLFNSNDQQLLLGTEVISLTQKESKVLQLLHNNFGELIPRETLMQKVWLDEGVITGRSLDMFISKLRRKLSRDPELRITNVHGKGYRLEMHVGQII